MPDVRRPKKQRSAINSYKLINQIRRERGLGPVTRPRSERWPARVAKVDVKRICAEVWHDQYPRSLTDATFVLGELTTKLVEQEVARRIQIIKGELTPYRPRR